MKIIAIIENERIILDNTGRVSYHSKAAIDVDGSGPAHNDPDYQNDTSLHLNGKPLNADLDCYIVVPPAIIHGVLPVVLGCQARVTYKGKFHAAVVGDISPKTKLGELSRALAIALGIPPSPVSGGEDDHIVGYELWPGKAAVVDGKAYDLQPS